VGGVYASVLPPLLKVWVLLRTSSRKLREGKRVSSYIETEPADYVQCAASIHNTV
jgi:hypothetical protein